MVWPQASLFLSLELHKTRVEDSRRVMADGWGSVWTVESVEENKRRENSNSLVLCKSHKIKSK